MWDIFRQSLLFISHISRHSEDAQMAMTERYVELQLGTINFPIITWPPWAKKTFHFNQNRTILGQIFVKQLKPLISSHCDVYSRMVRLSTLNCLSHEKPNNLSPKLNFSVTGRGPNVVQNNSALKSQDDEKPLRLENSQLPVAMRSESLTARVNAWLFAQSRSNSYWGGELHSFTNTVQPSEKE